ncbi:hypothetical protein EQ875_01629 [Photobacterium damselae subsp. damselae]|uniref:hypothetical protein n=1 Tax=Photobacterium damselae TaxID=38293 RepID=UPI00109BB820|nr:hypothetical protein [Photobacterium damselae]TGZ35348.1 hypothetical protein EQ875_01629 [Photobacterium damselae subsp. damselae]
MKDGFFKKHKLKIWYAIALAIALSQIEPANLTENGLIIAIVVCAVMAIPLSALLLGCYLFISSLFTSVTHK